jgi:hypothetical protein
MEKIMCDLCTNQIISDLCSDTKHLSIINGRRRIWELSSGWHCTVIGTCLTLSDLRGFARKLNVRTVPEYSVDYQLHGYFVKEADRDNKPGKMINKLLDKRHAISIRKLRKIFTVDALREFWDKSLNDGDIPGPYWAILSHPDTPEELGEQMFADVHMLSHLVGASNRANICKLQEVEEHIVNLDQKFNRQQRQHLKSLESRDETITELRTEIRNIQLAQEISAATPTESSKPYELLHPVPSRHSFSSLHKNIYSLSSELQASNSLIEQADKKVKNLEALVSDLSEENLNLEGAFLRNRQDDDQSISLDLTGQCLLYVGGQRHTVHRLRDLVENWNGKLIHHDGGLESSINELASAVTRADTIVFPIDCVSHSAANKVKCICHQTMKPFITLRTSGVGSFVTGLRDSLKSSSSII